MKNSHLQILSSLLLPVLLFHAQKEQKLLTLKFKITLFFPLVYHPVQLKNLKTEQNN